MITNSPPTIRRQPDSWSTTSATIDYSGGNYRLVAIGSATATVRRDFATNDSEQHTLEYNLALLNSGSATVKVQQLVGSSYVDIAGASQTHSASGSYTLTFTPSTSGTYKIEFYMAGASALCWFRVDNVLIQYTDEVTTTICNEIAEGYRYGFNSQESVDEISGVKNHYTAPFWEYDPRAVLRWNTDPKPHPSWSPYSIIQGNPIMYSDPYGDTVKYEGIKEWLQVGFARTFSKKFNQEFKVLKESKNVYTFNNTGARTGVTGGVSVEVENFDDEGSLINTEFSINYSTKEDFRKVPIGKSSLHGLFEETFHASDFEIGRSEISVFDIPDGGKALGWESQSQRIYGEAAAWKFAADNAPFSRSSGYFKFNYEGTQLKAYTSKTLIGMIKDASHIGEVARILFQPIKVEFHVPGTGLEGDKTIGPLYR